MATATWPLTIPQCPILNAFSEQKQRNVAAFAPDVGPPKLRRRSTATSWLTGLAFRMTSAEVEDFNTFYEDTLVDGTLPFEWAHPITKRIHTWFFDPKDTPKFDRMTADTFRVTFNLQRLAGAGDPPLDPFLSGLAEIVGYVPANYRNHSTSFFDMTDLELFDGGNRPAYTTNPPNFIGDYPNSIDGGTGSAHAFIQSAAIADPLGTTSASTFDDKAVSGEHAVWAYTSGTFVKNHPMRFAVIAKANTLTRIVGGLRMQRFPATSYYKYATVGFDLDGGNHAYDHQTDAGWTITASSMTSIGNQWWLCTFDAYFDPVAAGSEPDGGITPIVYLDNGSGTASRSTSYTGSGSGVYLWWTSLLPRGMWYLTTRTFFDDFNSLATIDTANTRTAGFNWYIHNKWSMCPMSGFAFKTGNPVDIAGLSVSSSILTWADASNNGTANVNYIYTAAPTTSSPDQYVGTAFGLPALFECKMGWGPRAQTPATWPAFWGDMVEGLTGQSNYVIEHDFLEANGLNLSDGAGGAVWLNIGPSTSSASSVDASRATDFPDSNGELHTYTGIVLPASSGNNFHGLRCNFYDGMAPGGNNAPVVWPAAGTSPASLGEADAHHLVLILAGGNIGGSSPGDLWPTYFDYVMVYQT